MYELSEYENGGTSTDILLIKEGNVSTEQTFSIQISTHSTTANLPAIEALDGTKGDYLLADREGRESLVLKFPPSLEVLNFSLIINDDDKAEGTEAFVLRSKSLGVPHYDFPIDTYSETTITIKDEDRKLSIMLDTVINM